MNPYRDPFQIKFHDSLQKISWGGLINKKKIAGPL
jgi:hypothetical protein